MTGVIPDYTQIAKEPKNDLSSYKETPKCIRENENMLVEQTKNAACRIETWMTQLFIRTGYGQRPGTVLKALFEADADIIPKPEKGILRVRIPGMAGKAMEKTVAPLLEALNETETKFPDTDLRLVYELPGWEGNMNIRNCQLVQNQPIDGVKREQTELAN